MKKAFFRALAGANRALLPKISRRNLNRLSRLDKAVVAFRYWVLMNALD